MKRPYDITFIEIKKTDNINSESFLKIDDYIFDENSINNYKKKLIYLIHYPNINVEFSTGIIYNIIEDNDNYNTILHFCETQFGSSGSPIINLDNYKVLGIHKGTLKNRNYNIGTFLKIPIQELRKYIKNNDRVIKKKNLSFRSDIRIPVLSKDNMKIINQQMEKCVCQIILENIQGTGFFCYIQFLDNPKFFNIFYCKCINRIAN